MVLSLPEVSRSSTMPSVTVVVLQMSGGARIVIVALLQSGRIDPPITTTRCAGIRHEKLEHNSVWSLIQHCQRVAYIHTLTIHNYSGPKSGLVQPEVLSLVAPESGAVCSQLVGELHWIYFMENVMAPVQRVTCFATGTIGTYLTEEKLPKMTKQEADRMLMTLCQHAREWFHSNMKAQDTGHWELRKCLDLMRLYMVHLMSKPSFSKSPLIVEMLMLGKRQFP